MDVFRRPRQYDPVSIFALASAALIGGGTAAAINASQSASAKKAATVASITPTTAQTVNAGDASKTANPESLGRAALISTSSQGVQGTDPTGRKTLLGN